MARRQFRLLAGVVAAALLAVGVDAYPSLVDCSTSLTSTSESIGGSHGRSQRTGSTQVQLAKNGNTIPCGGTLTADEAGLTLVKASSGVGSQYIIEAVASAGTGAWGIISGTCSMQRLVNSVSNTYTVPPSGTVTLRIAHAGGSQSKVRTSADCTYTVEAQASCSDCSAGEYLSDTSACTCTGCPSDSTSPTGSTAASACRCNAGQWCFAGGVRAVDALVRRERAVS